MSTEIQIFDILFAAKEGDLPTILRLVEQDSLPVDVHYEDGLTPLHIACRYDRPDVCEYLLSKGADAYFEASDKIRPVDLALEKSPKSLEVLYRKKLKDGICSVCLEEAPLFLLSCDHIFCLTCICEWFSSLMEEMDTLRCPHAECQEQITENDLHLLLPSYTRNLYANQCMRKCVGTMSDFFYCPFCPSGGFTDSTCDHLICNDCSEIFCRKCRKGHGGMTCEEARQCEEWKKNNTRPCPKCSVAIEKMGGCSHMRCRVCNYQFCWLCMGPYQGRYTTGPDCPCKK